jgi:ureidoacrylate peracid hydrolase
MNYPPVALSEESALTLDASRCALIIGDLQHDFLAAQGAYGRARAASPAAQALPLQLLPLAKVLKARGGFVVASLFTLWPDAQGEPMISPHLKRLRPFLRRGDFAPGSLGQAIVPELAAQVDVEIAKVAYSAFFNTQLDWLLKKARIDTVIIGGIVTNGGVASTARDAHMRDYSVIILNDGCAAFSEAAHQTSLRDLGTIAQVRHCDEVLQALQSD